jgi:hypothetical protein
MSDYDYLDKHDDLFEQQAGHMDKAFNHPLDNDPLSMVEDSITNPVAPTTLGPTPAPPGLIDTLPPLPVGREIIDRRMPSMPSDPLPDPNLPGERIFWGKEFISKPRGGTATSMTSSNRGKSILYNPKIGGVEIRLCPKGKKDKNGDTVIAGSKFCKGCDEYDPDEVLHHRCRALAREADKLAGKKGG